MIKAHSSHELRKCSTLLTMTLSNSQPNLNQSVMVDQRVSNFENNLYIDQISSSYLETLNLSSLNKLFIDSHTSRFKMFNSVYKNVIPGVTGLQNLGNTCYVNSVIQALSNTKLLTNYILTRSYCQDINKKNPLGYQGDLMNEFAFLITSLWKGIYKQISPLNFKIVVDKKNNIFSGNNQHDSHEFLLFILDGIHEDLNIGVSSAKVELPLDCDKLNDEQKAHLSWKTHLTVNNSVIVKMFQGQFRSKITCNHCLKSSVTFDAFMYLSLPLVFSNNKCSLDECINLFLSEEKMIGASQWFCPECKMYRNASKKIDLWKLPLYLLIHLKRFSFNEQCRQKLNTCVDFPLESLSLSEVLLDNSSQSHKHEMYNLYAVSNHKGNMESGHYTSFCKNINNNRWYSYDDEVVTSLEECEVKTSSAYILFYESCNLNKSIFKTDN